MPRPRFSLKTLLVVVTVCGTAGYWYAMQTAFWRASEAYERAVAGWNADTILTDDLCKSSVRLFEAEVSVPFSSRSKAAAAHLSRLEGIRERVYWIADNAYLGGANASTRMRAEIDSYYADAERRIAENIHAPTP
jgi:hypothetical protein